MRGTRILSLLLVCILCFGMMCEAHATDFDKEIKETNEKINETKEKAEELEQQKAQVEAEKEALSIELNTIIAEMEELEKKIEKKGEEIAAKEEELIQAKIEENDQYESMKVRIKYMYENGDVQLVELLCEAKNFSDFLNRTEYISTISEYDRNMLEKYKAIVKKVEEQEKALQEEQKEMEALQDELIAKQAELEELISDKANEISGLEDEISANAETLKELEKAAAEAARKKAEAEAAARAAMAAQSSGAGAAVISGSGIFTHPCPGYRRISSTFGYRKAPKAGASTNHKGVDFAAATGTPIYAASGGTVTSAGYSGNAGNMIVINHGGGLSTYYMHCSKIYVRSGMKVDKGQNIGAVGTTGNSTGPHLHFQVMYGGSPVNPLNYL